MQALNEISVIRLRGHFLHPGMLLATATPHEVTTILGSCVSVCLWDRRLGVGGINHYLLPFWNGEGLPSPRYGNIAINKLLKKMLRLGATRTALVAKVFGGSSLIHPTNSFTNVGERNVALAMDMLKDEKIKVISSDTSGHAGRKLIYNTLTGIVRVKKLQMKLIKDRGKGKRKTVVG